MNTIYQNDYLTIKVDKNNSVYYWDWTTKSEEMTIEIFLAQGDTILKEFLKSSCRNIIDNATNLRFLITPDIQENIANQMLSVINGKCDKVAHVYSEELIVGLSMEQLWDENKRTYEEKFFQTLDEAIKWLNA